MARADHAHQGLLGAKDEGMLLQVEEESILHGAKEEGMLLDVKEGLRVCSLARHQGGGCAAQCQAGVVSRAI